MIRSFKLLTASLAILLLNMGASLLPSSAVQAQGNRLGPVVITIKNVNSGKCLSTAYSNTTNNSLANQWTCRDDKPIQKWIVESNGRTTLIRSYLSPTKCLSLDPGIGIGAAFREQGQWFRLRPCGETSWAQRFDFETISQSDQIWKIKLASTGKCLGVDHGIKGNTYDGINQWNCVVGLRQDIQRWQTEWDIPATIQVR